MFDNPSVASQVSDTVRRILGDTERIRENAGRISRASVVMERNFAKMVNSTSQVAANLQAVVSSLQNAAGSSNNVRQNMGGASTNTKQTAQAANQTQQNLRQSGQQASRLSGVMKGIGNIIKGTILVGITAVSKAFLDVQRQGFALNQTLEITKNAFEDFFSVFRTGVFGLFGDFAKARTGLAGELGSLNKVTDDLVNSTVELVNVYNVSERAAAGINAQLFRWSGRNAQLVKSQQAYTVALAKANGVAPGKLIEQMAQNTEEMARYAGQGAEGFARQLVVLNKMGVSMRSISSVADRLVNDFEGSLESAAKLQTFLPGFDISGLQFAAQFGTPEQVAVELQTALQRSGISSLQQLPRSLQNAIGSSLGMPLTEIQNLLTNTQEDTEVKPVTPADYDSGVEKLAASTITQTAQLIGVLTGNNIATNALIYRGYTQIVKAINAKNTGPNILGSRRTGTFGRRARSLAAGLSMQGSLLAGRLGTSAVGRGVLGAGRAALAAGKIGARVVPGLGLAVGAATGADEFVESKRAGLDTSKALVNAIIKPLTFGLFTPFEKVKDATEQLVDSKEKEKKAAEENALRQAAAAAGVKNLDFAMRELERRKTGAALNQATGLAPNAAESPGFFARAGAATTNAWDWTKSKFSSIFTPSAEPVVDKSKFVGKMHDGGVVGDNLVGKGNTLSDLQNLKPRETIAILEQGEVVLTPAQMGAMGRAVGGGMRGNLSNIINGFLNSFNLGSNRIVQSIRSALTDKGGVLGKISEFFGGSNIGQSIANKLSGITNKLGPVGDKIQGFVGGLQSKVQGFTGGLLDKGMNFLQGKVGGGGGILSGITKMFGGGNNAGSSIVKSLTGGGTSGLSNMLGGNLKSTAANLVGKIPGIGGIAKSFLGGGGVKGIGSSLLKGGLSKLGGAKIGATIGSIIPGAGTIVGGLIGGGLSKLANTGIGRAIGGFVSKTPIGKIAGGVGKAIGGIGKKLGGLFGRKKKKEPTPPTPAPLDVGGMAGLAGMFGMGAAGMPAILSMFGGAGDAGLAARIGMIPGGSAAGGQSQPVALDTTNLESKIDQLINLMRSGGIAVNLDGRKVSTGLLEANRYG